jgi:mannose-6-phosphate isomerase-like protein (cupin superfamily)
VRYCLQPGETPLFGAERGCDEFEQRILQFSEAGEPQVNADDDELLYVLAGAGAATVGDTSTERAPGTAAFVPRGTPWRVEGGDGLEILSVLVRRPLPAEGHAVFDLAASEADSATAGRMFRLLANPDAGCPSVTQFVGYIPIGRAPDHFHTYDEVVYVLEGEGALHIDGETARLTAGTSVHLPARIVHCLENVGPGEMQVLGVFRPAGSPAEAYYPDGTRAQY